MKKYLLVTLLACMAFTAQAKILRVNNTSGNSAPYTSISAALDEAVNGDTIMVDASNTSYGDVTINVNKKVVMIGPGYWLVQNGIVQEGISSAMLGKLTIKTAGVVIKGLNISSINISSPKVVIQRCLVGSILMSRGSDNCVFCQNYITGDINVSESQYSWSRCYNIQITNNIFIYQNAYDGATIRATADSYIAYNTFVRKLRYSGDKHLRGLENSTIEHNIISVEGTSDNSDGCSFSDNYTYISSNAFDSSFSPYTDYSTDLAVRKTELSFSEGKYGAFAGDDPYVISGVPSGPVIEDIVVPTTVEKGNTMSVTIKVGITK